MATISVAVIDMGKLVRRYTSSLVIAEHDEMKLTPVTLNSITAATKLGGDVSCLVVGTRCSQVAKEVSQVPGVKNVLVAEHDIFRGLLAEAVSPVVLAMQSQFSFSHILAASSSFSKALIPYVSAKLGVSSISDIIYIKDANTFKRCIYAGNAIQTVTSSDKVKLITVRSTCFEAASTTGGSGVVSQAPTDTVASAKLRASFVGQKLTKQDRPPLTSAKIIISGGRGLGSADNFQMLFQLADRLGAAVGASRAAVDSGYVPNELQIGQTGKIVAPDLYVAVGISGAIQHVAGMKGSRVIVAINKDPHAPIFDLADYGLVQDLFQAIPELIKLVDKK